MPRYYQQLSPEGDWFILECIKDGSLIACGTTGKVFGPKGELSQRTDKKGYKYVRVQRVKEINGIRVELRKEISVHRLVWMCINGPIPDNHEVHHKDKVRDHNCIKNLNCLSEEEHYELHQREMEDKYGPF